MVIAEDKEIDIFVASKIGSFKHIKFHTDTSKNSKKNIENVIAIKTLVKDDCITSMEWANDDQREILIAKKNGKIQTYNTQLDAFTKTYTFEESDGDIVGLGRHKRKLIAGCRTGIVKVWGRKDELIQDCGKCDVLKVCPDDSTMFATGGEENDLKIWRIGDTTPVFSAKNLPHDSLQLRRAVWVSDLSFLPREGGNIVAVCSRLGYVRLYDTRAQRRPVCNVEMTVMAATCISPGFDERQVLVGFGRGQLHQVDLRVGRPDKGFKGSVGAISSIKAVDNPRLIVSTSLDRHIRVHRWESKELVYKQYLTSKLSCALVQTNNSTPLRNANGEEVKEESAVEKIDELDQLFDEMEKISETPKKKKHIIKEDTEDNSKKFKPSAEGSTVDIDQGPDDAIVKLLRSTEKRKRRIEKKKKEKKAKSVFHNA